MGSMSAARHAGYTPETRQMTKPTIIAMGIGCFQGWGWVWTVALIFAVFNILLAFWNWWVAGHTMGGLFSAFLGIIIPLIIIWYLYKDNVKAYFGKA
jgi:hypothetical protein